MQSLTNIFGLFEVGGPTMYLLALLAFLMCVIFLERLLYLHRGKTHATEFVEGIKQSLKKHRLLEAITICDESFGPVPIVVKEALLNSENSPEIMSASVNSTAVNQFALLSRRVASLALIARIAPLVGLMGTVLALYQIFGTMGVAHDYVSYSEMAASVKQALVSTAFGLFVAVLSWLGYSFLNSKLKALAQDIDWAANETMLFIIRGQPEREDLYIKGNKKAEQ